MKYFSVKAFIDNQNNRYIMAKKVSPFWHEISFNIKYIFINNFGYRKLILLCLEIIFDKKL